MRHPSLKTLLLLLSLTSLAQASYAQIAAEPSPFASDNPNAVVPGEMSVVAFSPRLNESGNSVRALLAIEHISNALSLSLFK